MAIHTKSMRENNLVESDVNLAELAALSKNFSGAEIAGLIRSATSFALVRHTEVGQMAKVKDNLDDIMIRRDDFMKALEEIKPAFGTSVDGLMNAMPNGIFHFSPNIDRIIQRCLKCAETLRTNDRVPILSVLLHGQEGSGKTALAAHIALQADFPYTKMISPATLTTLADEIAKRNYVNKVFSDAYKSPLSVVIIDEIEELIDFSPIGLRYSNIVLRTIMVHAKTHPPKVNLPPSLTDHHEET